MSKRSVSLRALVTERLAAAAEEISALVERTMAEYEEELRRCREENLSKQRLLDEVLRQLHGKVIATADSELRLKQEPPQIKEEPEEHISSEPHRQTLRALVTERLTAAAEDIFVPVERTIAEFEEELCRCKEENQRKQQLLEALGPHRGAVNHHSANPTAEALPVLKQENRNNVQFHEVVRVQVKEEDPEELPVAAVTDTESPTDENAYLTDTRNMAEGVQTWTAPLKEEEEDLETEDRHSEQGQSAEREFSVFPKNKTKSCSICKMKFVRTCELKRHMTNHSCPFCERVFAEQKNLKRHVMLHTGELPFQCPECGKRCRTKGLLNLHIKNIHSLERAFSCSVCGMTFKTNHHLKTHMYQHTGKRAFQCSVCEESFKRKYELQGHMLKHTGNLAKTQKAEEQDSN